MYHEGGRRGCSTHGADHLLLGSCVCFGLSVSGSLEELSINLQRTAECNFGLASPVCLGFLFIR